MNILIAKDLQIVLSPENGAPYTNCEYKTISVWFQGAEVFTKENGDS